MNTKIKQSLLVLSFVAGVSLYGQENQDPQIQDMQDKEINHHKKIMENLQAFKKIKNLTHQNNLQATYTTPQEQELLEELKKINAEINAILYETNISLFDKYQQLKTVEFILQSQLKLYIKPYSSNPLAWYDQTREEILVMEWLYAQLHDLQNAFRLLEIIADTEELPKNSMLVKDAMIENYRPYQKLLTQALILGLLGTGFYLHQNPDHWIVTYFKQFFPA